MGVVTIITKSFVWLRQTNATKNIDESSLDGTTSEMTDSWPSRLILMTNQDNSTKQTEILQHASYTTELNSSESKDSKVGAGGHNSRQQTSPPDMSNRSDGMMKTVVPDHHRL